MGEETRSSSYDVLTAHTAIVFTRYMMLVLEQWRNINERSIGKLFYLTIGDLEDQHYLEALALLLDQLMYCTREAEILGKNQLNQLLKLVLTKLLSPCENT